MEVHEVLIMLWLQNKSTEISNVNVPTEGHVSIPIGNVHFFQKGMIVYRCLWDDPCLMYARIDVSTSIKAVYPLL